MHGKSLPFCLLLGLVGLNAPTLADEPMRTQLVERNCPNSPYYIRGYDLWY